MSRVTYWVLFEKVPLGERIRELRRRRRWSQARLAEGVGSVGGQSQVSKWERAEGRPSFESVLRLMSAFEVGIDAFAVVAEGVEPDLKHFDPEGELPDGSWVYSKVESSFGRDSPRWWWAFYHPEGDDSLPESYEDSDVLFRIFDWAKRRTGFREFAEAVEKTENQIGFLGAAYTLAERQGLSVEEFRELDRLRDEWLQARVDAQQDTRRHGRYSAPSPEDPATLPDEVEDPTPPPVDAEKVAEVSDAYSSLPDDSTGAAGAPE